MEDTVQLRHFTSWRVGGAPSCYFRPLAEADLQRALCTCRQCGLEWRVLGGGSNLLVEEGRLPYAVIHVRDPGFAEVQRLSNGRLRVGAGLRTARLLSYCRTHSLSGAEFLAALPGTVGGAAAGNAGAWGASMADLLVGVRTISSEGRCQWRTRNELSFGYRRSGLDDCVITAVELQLQPADPGRIARATVEYARRRAAGHPLGTPSAGCVFKNPPGYSAGKLLDLCGLKGLRIGDAMVSERHANFVLNAGRATANDILQVVDRMRQSVKQSFGIDLELEVRRWPADGRVA